MKKNSKLSVKMAPQLTPFLIVKSKQKVYKKSFNLLWHHFFIWSTNRISSEFRPIFIQLLFRSVLENKFISPPTFSNSEQGLLK